jgi:signal transduction histidine kinase
MLHTETERLSRLVDDLVTASSLVADGARRASGRHHSRIGEKFYRVDPELLHAAPGLGLGLYICRRLAALMNGRLSFESAAGTGSTFILELPTDSGDGARSHRVTEAMKR